MRICLIELMPFPFTKGGGTTHIINLGKALTMLGNEVHVISSKPGDDYEREDCPEGLIVHNVGIKHKKFERGVFYYFYRLFFELLFVLGALRELNKIKPDVIDCQSPITTALPAILSRFKTVITCHGIHSQGFGKLHMAKGNKFTGEFLNRIYFAIARFNVRRAKRLISQGNATVSYYSKLAGDKRKEFIVNNLVDSDFWKPVGKRNNKLIVVLTRFTKQKALDKLLLAMRELKDYHLVLGGGGELEGELRKIAGKNVEFKGFMLLEECRTLRGKARFIIVPSEFEGLPYSVLESMSCGVIPITTKVGDLPVLIQNGKNGFLLKDNNPKTIVDVVRKIPKGEMDKLSKKARQTIVDKYSLEKVGKEFIRAYES